MRLIEFHQLLHKFVWNGIVMMPFFFSATPASNDAEVALGFTHVKHVFGDGRLQFKELLNALKNRYRVLDEEIRIDEVDLFERKVPQPSFQRNVIQRTHNWRKLWVDVSVTVHC
jgi:hypothetical protein